MLKKILHTRWYQSCLNNWFLIVIGIILLCLSWNYIFCLIPFLIYLFYLFYHQKQLFVTTIILSIVFIFVLLFLQLYLQDDDQTIITGNIISIEDKEYEQELVIKSGLKKRIVRHQLDIPLKVGMKVKVYGTTQKADENHLPYAFNYHTYLKHQGIVQIMKASDIEIKGKVFHLSILKEKVKSYLDRHFQGESQILLYGFLLGDTSGFDDEFKSAVQKNGIVHLFAISGLHVSLFVSFLGTIFSFFHMKEKKQTIFIFLFLGIYVIITDFSPSILRAAGMYYFAYFNQKLKCNFSSLDRSSILFLLLLFYHPYWMYHLGFVLSFFICFYILLITPLVHKKNSILQSLIISLGSILLTIPLVVNRTYQLNLLSPLVNIIMISIVTLVVLPCSFMVVIFPFLKGIYQILVQLFSSFVHLSSMISISIPIPHFTFFDAFIYYGIFLFIFLFFHKKKIKIYLSSLLGILFCIFCLIGHQPIIPTVEFLDLYNGDSTIITYHNDIVIIDTGDGSSSALTQYLKAKGVHSISGLILTHEHQDHLGEASKLIQEFNVHKIIMSAYNDSEYRFLSNTLFVRKGDIFQIGSLFFEVLHPDHNYDQENDNSLVLYTTIDGVHFLFTADASKTVEKNFSTYPVDVIKIGHHGSKTSTSLSFIQNIHPTYAIIMTGRVKRFSFPDEEVIQILNQCHVKIYRTDLNSTITLKNIQQKCIFSTLR